MKKKIAFLMAAVMVFAAVPAMSLSATAGISVSGHEDLLSDTLMASGTSRGPVGATVGGEDIDYVTSAARITITPNLDSDILNGLSFRLVLTGAEYMFANVTKSDNTNVLAVGEKTFPLYTGDDSFPDPVALRDAEADRLVVTAILSDITAAEEIITDLAIVNAGAINATEAIAFNTLYDTGVMATAKGRIAAINDNVLKAAATLLVDTTLGKGVASLDGTDFATGDGVTALVAAFTAAIDTTGDAVALVADAQTIVDSVAIITVPGSGFVTNGPAVDDAYTSLQYWDEGVHTLDITIVSDGAEAIIDVVVPDRANRVGHYNKENSLQLELPMWMGDSGEVTARVQSQSPTSSIATTTLIINRVNRNAGTNITIESVKSGRTRVALDKITITESITGILTNGLFQVRLTSGFMFLDPTNAKITAETGLAIAGNELTLTRNENAWLLDEGRTLVVNLEGLTPSTRTQGRLFITGLSVAPTDDTLDGENYFGTTVKADFKGIDKLPTAITATTVRDVNSGLKEQTGVEIAKFADYGVSFDWDDTAKAKVTEAYSGKEGIEAGIDGEDIAKITIKENVAQSWIAERALNFTLTDADGNVLDGVKFDTFEITNQDNTGLATGKEYDVVDTSATNDQVRFRRDRIQVTGPSAVESGKLASMKVRVSFNTAANFTGDVYLTISGYAVAETQSLKVATVAAPLTVTAEKSNVAVGYQTYGIGNITVTENAAGVLDRNKTVDLVVREFANMSTGTASDVQFNPVTVDTVRVTAGNLGINKLDIIGGGTDTASVLRAHINRVSTEASTFTLSGLSAKIYHYAPFGTYDLVVGGDSWVETYDRDAEDNHPGFTVQGLVVEGYVDITSPGSSVTVARNVEIVQGSRTAIVDGAEVEMDAATYIDPASNRTMLPLRSVSYLFNIREENIVWVPADSTATIIVNDRVVTFTEGSAKMRLNGVEVDMVDENGVSVSAAINPENGRMYVPLTQLGLAFGIETLWIPSNPGVAVFNPTQAQKDTAANTTSAPAATVEPEAVPEEEAVEEEEEAVEAPVEDDADDDTAE